MATSLDQSYTSGNNALYYGYTDHMYLAQSFVPDYNGKLTKISMNLKKNGSPTGNTTCYLASDTGTGKPSAVIATINTLDNGTLTDEYDWYDFEINVTTAPDITAGTTYHIMLEAAESATNYVLVKAINADAYTDGYANYASNELSWTSLTDWDCNFKTYTTYIYVDVSENVTMSEGAFTGATSLKLSFDINKSDNATLTESIGKTLVSLVGVEDNVTLTENNVHTIRDGYQISIWQENITLTDQVEWPGPRSGFVEERISMAEKTTVKITTPSNVSHKPSFKVDI